MKFQMDKLDLKTILLTIIVVVPLLACGCAITLGIYYLICLCFNIPFYWLHGIGVYLILFLVNLAIAGGNRN